MIALPTNKDENWRYANLRPLAKANADAVAANTAPAALALPAPLPDYERWVFVDGWFAPDLSTNPASSCATLLNARDAGEDFSAMLDAAIANCYHPHVQLWGGSGAKGSLVDLAPVVPDRAEEQQT